MRLRLHCLFAVCFFLFSIAAMHGQSSSFVESVAGDGGNGTSCKKYSTKKLAISCTGSWSTSDADGYEVATAKNGFGPMEALGYSSVTIAQNGANVSDSGNVSEIIEDDLSVIGWNGTPAAFLKLEFECVPCIHNIYPAAYYDAYALLGNIEYGPCQIYGPANVSVCALRVPLVYNSNTEQTTPVFIERQLQVSATTNVANGPEGATITTTVCVGAVGGCATGAATIKASVVNAKGEVIDGVTVVGASGHIYN
jgi:hypothetical protein